MLRLTTPDGDWNSTALEELYNSTAHLYIDKNKGPGDDAELKLALTTLHRA